MFPTRLCLAQSGRFHRPPGDFDTATSVAPRDAGSALARVMRVPGAACRANMTGARAWRPRHPALHRLRRRLSRAGYRVDTRHGADTVPQRCSATAGTDQDA